MIDRVRLEHFAATARRLEQERAAAAGTVERLLRETPRADWPALAEHAQLQTCGALERLGNLFADTLTKDPVHANAIAELAVAVAEGLAPDSYPAVILAQLRAHAWKDLGKALRFVGRNHDSISAFDTAEQKLDGHGALAHDRAIVRFNLAMSLQELERFNESLKLLVECKHVFRDHGDTRNVVLCGLAEGVLLQRLCRFREARERYLLLLASTRELDHESLAAIHHAIGFCSVELDDDADAEANLLHAISLYRRIAQPIQILNVELGRGRLFIRKGDANAGIAHLRPVRREFLRKGMHEEAGICGLEIVGALLLVGRTSAAEALARKIVREFTLAGLNTRAITALGYLSEAITARNAAPGLVRNVRDYILSLRTKPEREFRATHPTA